MKKEDAELKANALGKDLIAKDAEHKGTGNKYTISAVEALVDEGDDANYDVYCLLSPSENNFQTLSTREEIDDFLLNYKVTTALDTSKTLLAS